VILISYVICTISMLPTLITCTLWYFVIVRFNNNIASNNVICTSKSSPVPVHDYAPQLISPVALHLDSNIFARGFFSYFFRSLHQYEEMHTIGSETVAAPLLSKEPLECEVGSCVDSDSVVVFTDTLEHNKHSAPDSHTITSINSPVDSARVKEALLSGEETINNHSTPTVLSVQNEQTKQTETT